MASERITNLEEQARSFAASLSESVSAFVGESVPFKATSSGSRFVVSDNTGGVLICIGDGAHLALEVTFRCELDGSGQYLKVVSSRISAYAGKRPRGDPLFRYEYLNDPSGGLPSGHLHVHAHRDQFTRIMTLAAVSGASRRRANPDAELEASRLSKIHFPTGGHRFRPTLEDVLQMIEVEFGVVPGALWPGVLRKNRSAWRRQQTAATVRDCPSEAVRILRDLGYSVGEPEGGAVPDKEDRLEAF